MEPLVPPDVLITGDPRERLDDVLGGRVDRSDIDVRTFLLDPPPTEAEVARTERRRMLVRRGSVAVAAIVAVLLVAPWPSGGADGGASVPGASPEPAETGFDEPIPPVTPPAVRLDAAPATARSRRSVRVVRAARKAPRPPVRAPASTTRSPAPRTTIQPASRVVPGPAAPRPAAPAPVPSGGAGDAIRAPVL